MAPPEKPCAHFLLDMVVSRIDGRADYVTNYMDDKQCPRYLGGVVREL